MRLFAQRQDGSDVLAEYIWGRNMIELSKESALAQGFFAPALQGVWDRRMPFQDESQFKGFVALLHELAHCLQDNLTGVGHWDWLVRGKMLANAFRFGKNIAWRLHEQQRDLDAVARDYADQSFVNAGDGQWELDAMAARLRGLASDGLVRELRTVSLLELDAYLNVQLVVMWLAGTEKQHEIEAAHRAYYGIMSSPYRDLWLAVLRTLNAGLGEIETPERLTSLMKIATYLLDSALAVPSPSYIRAHGGDREDYLPGVKLIRILCAFHEAPRQFRFFRRDDATRIDGMSRKTRWFKYPSVDRAYKSWLDEFATVSEPWLVPSARGRAALVRQRLKAPAVAASRSPATLVEFEIPFHTRIGSDSGKVLAFGAQVTDEMRAIADSADDALAVYTAMAHHIMGLDSAYWCPRALSQGSRCPLCSEACVRGIVGLNNVPRNDQCTVRSQLASLDWNDSDELRDASMPKWA